MSGTLSATAAASNIAPRELSPGLNAVPFYFNSGANTVDASATTILLCKIPNKATIVDFVAHHTIGAATCPADYGVSGGLGLTGASSLLASALATGSIARGKAGGIPFKISLSDDAANNFVYLQAVATPATATTSLIIQGTVYYTMDGL